MVSAKILKKIRNFPNKLKNNLGLQFYKKNQTYDCCYQVNLKNNSSDSQILTLVIPVPMNNQNQYLITECQFSDKPLLAQDEYYGNSYASFELKLNPHQEKVIEQNFKISVSPSSMPQTRIYPFKDYDHQSNKFINAQRNEIVQLAKKFKSTSNDVLEVAKKINDYVVDYLEYANPIPGLYSSDEAFDTKKVDCGGFDTLFAALCIASNIPARVVSGFWAGYADNTMHAWAEFLLPNGMLVIADPSMEYLRQRKQTAKSGQFGFGGSDRIIFSKGCDIPLMVGGKKIFTDILQNPLVYGDDTSQIGVSVEFLTQRL